MVQRENKENYELVGVVSWGFGCGLQQFPDVYDRVAYAHYMDWIIRETSQDTTCPA